MFERFPHLFQQRRHCPLQEGEALDFQAALRQYRCVNVSRMLQAYLALFPGFAEDLLCLLFGLLWGQLGLVLLVLILREQQIFPGQRDMLSGE